MRLICPGCGLTASAEAWLNDAEARELLLAVAKMPAPLPSACLPYLGLFRPESRALSWKKAGKLVAELATLTGSGYVQVQGKPARPCPPRTWATAMEQMVARRDRLSRPMPNHNYLRQMAWQLADEADLAAEKKRDEAAANRHGRTGMEEEGPSSLSFGDLTEREIAFLPESLRKKHFEARDGSVNPLAKIMGDGE